ncbi:MAG: hypothetical protein J5608_00275 [Alphaproteobacteria bacterium]|nr:hypothetical protein [Alphaproteobacteria bacterium]
MGKSKNKARYNHIPKTITVDLGRTRIGGNYAAMLRAKKVAEVEAATAPLQFSPERMAYVEKQKQAISQDEHYWAELTTYYDAFEKQDGLTRDEYYEISKFAVNTYPDQIVGVRADKMTDARYYEVCKIMANNGVFSNFDFAKANRGRDGGVYRIAQTAIESFGKLEYHDELSTAIRRINEVARGSEYMTQIEAARVLFHMWLVVQNPWVSGVSNQRIADMYNKGLITEALAGQYVKQVYNASQTQKFAAVLQNYDYSEIGIPGFCKDLYYKITGIYDRLEKQRTK